MRHELKCWPPYFNDVKTGIKTFEVRRWDRHFAVGDELLLREWDPHDQEYTGRVVSQHIVYLFEGGTFGLDPRYCILGIAP